MCDNTLLLDVASLWPSQDAFLFLAPSSSKKTGAVLTALAVCDSQARGKSSFYSGEPVLICTEWLLKQPTHVLSVGVILEDEKGAMLFGKESFQVKEAPTISRTPPLWKVRACYRLVLRIRPGRYKLRVRLSQMSFQNFEAYRGQAMSTQELLPRLHVLGEGEKAAEIVVRAWPGEQVPHQGVIDLVESLGMEAMPPQRRLPAKERKEGGKEGSSLPALIHVTHQKAGSQWIHRILRDAFPQAIVPPRVNNEHFLNAPVEMGKVYPTVYLTKEEFDKAQLPARWYRFVIVRDLRDTLVSAYFSIKYSHPPVGPIPQWRSLLHTMGKEEGMIWLLREWLPDMARIQLSWWYAGERIIKYEDLLQRDVELLAQILIAEAQWPLSYQQLEEIVMNYRFEHFTKRKRGEEDLLSHERKGIIGDWRNHFTSRLKEAFKAYYGGVLVALNYEKDLAW